MRKKFLLSTIAITLVNIFVIVFILDFLIIDKMKESKHIWDVFFENSISLMYLIIAFFICLGVSYLIYQIVINPIKQLKQEMERAENDYKKAEKMRSEFVTNVTHELKTPLTSISGFIETLQEGADENPEIRKRFLDIIAIETARLKRLIEDILVLSDIENKKEVFEENNIDVKENLLKIIETIKPMAESKGVFIDYELENDCIIKGSTDRFVQMFMNLIENAIKYSKDGGQSKIKISSYKEIDDKEVETIVVSVADNGIGIPEKHISRLFERFYRVDKSRTKKGGGTGLGLSIVKHIAILFDANIKVESEEGVGSKFIVTFK